MHDVKWSCTRLTRACGEVLWAGFIRFGNDSFPIMSAMSSCRIRNGVQMVSGRLFGRPIRQKMRRTLSISFASTVTLNLWHVSTSSKISFFNYSIFLPMNPWSTALHRHYSKTNLTVELSDEFHRLLVIQPSPKFGHMPKPFVKPADNPCKHFY